MSEQPDVATFGELIAEGILEIGDGYRAKLEELGGDGPIFLRAGLLSEQGLNWDAGERFHEELASKLQSKLGRPGDTLVTTKGNSVGRTGYVPKGAPSFVYSPHLSYWRSLDPGRLYSRFLYSWSRSDEFATQLRAMAYSTDMAPYLSLTDQRHLKITLPDVATQRAAARVLGALDDKIAVNERVARTSLALAQAEYDEVAKSASWRSLSMRESAHWLSGGTPSTSEPSYWGGDMPWISALSLKSPWVADSDRRVSQLGVEHGTRVVSRGTTIFVVRGSSLDSEFRIGLTQREVAFGQDCKALLAADGIDPTVLFLAIRSRTSDVLNLVDHTGHGAGRLATDLIANVLIRLPGHSPEAAPCHRLRYLVDLGAKRQAENRTLLELRDTLLPKLMSGRIRVREAERIVEDAT
jgi:type I restriction enzyme, S subunit